MSKIADQPASRSASVALSQIELDDKLNVRHKLFDEPLEELKDSIKALGLLQPIVVMKPKEDGGKYKLLIGQRRYKAFKELGYAKIPAIVIDYQDQKTAIALSLSENMYRSELSHEDMAEAVSKLYDLYKGDINKIARDTGIWPETVRRYVYVTKIAPKHALGLVSKGKVSLLDVKRALRVADGNAEKAGRILDEMARLSGSGKRRLADTLERRPSTSVEKAVEEARRPRSEYVLSIDLTDEMREGLDQACKKSGRTRDELAAEILRDWLHEQGYWPGK